MKKNLKYGGNKQCTLGVHLFCRWTSWNILIMSQLAIMLPEEGWCICLLWWWTCWVCMVSATSLPTWSSTPPTYSLWRSLPPLGSPTLQVPSSWRQASHQKEKPPSSGTRQADHWRKASLLAARQLPWSLRLQISLFIRCPSSPPKPLFFWLS